MVARTRRRRETWRSRSRPQASEEYCQAGGILPGARDQPPNESRLGKGGQAPISLGSSYRLGRAPGG